MREPRSATARFVRRYVWALVLALPAGYGLGAIATYSLAVGEVPSAEEVHAWGMLGALVAAVSIVLAVAALAIFDGRLRKGIVYRAFVGGLATVVGLLAIALALELPGLVSDTTSHSSGATFYLATLVAGPAGISAALLIGLTDAAAFSLRRRAIRS